MEKWMIYSKRADFDKIAEKYQISPMIARIIRNRDVQGEKEVEEYLNGTIDDMHSPWLLDGMEDAVKILNNKIKEAKKIRVVSDYDIDGTCAGYILVSGLEELGAIVDLKIPDRIKEGYGINQSIIEKAYADGIDTIVTCDNGIAAIDAIARAKELKMTVIVTDHHEVGFKETWRGKEYLYPEADVIIDPKKENCKYPCKDICGATVAYKLVEALFLHFGKAKEDVHKYLEYAAIATVGDVVRLIGENRIIVKYGLVLLNRTTNIGLAKLIKANHLEDTTINSYHIGFVLGPCINAAGRLDTARMVYQLLCEKDEEKAEALAEQLTQLNQKRKEMTNEGVEMAKQELQAFEEYPVLVIYLPEVHESVAGIIAGRIRDYAYRPTIILTDAEDGVKGSGRSIDGYDMFKELNKCKNFLKKFGGHTMAAGLSLDEDNIEAFRRVINRNCLLEEKDFVRKIWIDVAMPFEYASMDFTKQLEILEPFGNGNEKPAFGEKNVSIVRIRLFGENQNVVKLELTNNSDCRADAIYFDHNHDFMTYLKETYGEEEVNKAMLGRPNAIRLSIIYYPEINEYRGYKKVQITIKNYK